VCGRVDIAGGGVRHEITFAVDRIAQKPVADIRRRAGVGSEVRASWPSGGASSGDVRHVLFLPTDALAADGLVEQRVDDVRALAEGFAFLNPHLTITVVAFGDDVLELSATDPCWQKWTPRAPTSPHWYEREHLERLISAKIAHDGGGTVRDFLAEFRGLSSTGKRKAILGQLGLAGQPLSCLLTGDGRDFDHARIAQLLNTMRAQTKPVSAKHLGVIGREHIATRFGGLGVVPESVEYKRIVNDDDDGLPQVIEVAFGVLENQEQVRRLVTGVNWSATWLNPFRDLGSLRGLDAILEQREFGPDQPIALLIHVAHPRVTYTDRGKSTVVAR
jgi:hypothetical protein